MAAYAGQTAGVYPDNKEYTLEEVVFLSVTQVSDLSEEFEPSFW